jgi:nitric oxide reductase activation protein
MVVVSDGLAYDTGYELSYGAEDAKHALSETRNQGIGCLCLSIGANTDAESLERVFGSAAYAAIRHPSQLNGVVGPLFFSALRAAEIKRSLS